MVSKEISTCDHDLFLTHFAPPPPPNINVFTTACTRFYHTQNLSSAVSRHDGESEVASGSKKLSDTERILASAIVAVRKGAKDLLTGKGATPRRAHTTQGGISFYELQKSRKLEGEKEGSAVELVMATSFLIYFRYGKNTERAAADAHNILKSDPTRKWVYAMVTDGHEMSLLWCSRSQNLVSDPFHLNDVAKLMKILIIFLSSSEQELGCEGSISDREDDLRGATADVESEKVDGARRGRTRLTTNPAELISKMMEEAKDRGEPRPEYIAVPLDKDDATGAGTIPQAKPIRFKAAPTRSSEPPLVLKEVWIPDPKKESNPSEQIFRELHNLAESVRNCKDSDGPVINGVPLSKMGLPAHVQTCLADGSWTKLLDRIIPEGRQTREAPPLRRLRPDKVKIIKPTQEAVEEELDLSLD